MDASNRRRIWAYSAFAISVSGLAWLGWGREAEADPGLLLDCAMTQMQIASGIPDASDSGREVRLEILQRAEEFLARAERLAPEHPQVVVARGDLELLRGERRVALAAYERASTNATPKQLDLLALRRAQIHLELEHPDAALAELDAIDAAGPSHIETNRRVLETDCRLLLGEPERADAAARMARDSGGIEASIAVGEVFERHAMFERAEQSYRNDAVPPAVADYYSARLKARQGEFDTAYELLLRAVDSDRESATALAQRDAREWVTGRDDERFRDLIGLPLAAPR